MQKRYLEVFYPAKSTKLAVGSERAKGLKILLPPHGLSDQNHTHKTRMLLNLGGLKAGVPVTNPSCHTDFEPLLAFIL